MERPSIRIHDPTLRDGQHAVRHQLQERHMAAYAAAADRAAIPVVEVGHGNGLGASSLQAGRAALTDRQMLRTVRAALRRSRMAVFMLPGWGMIRDIEAAAGEGADIVRIGAHCTEANVTERYLGHVNRMGLEAQGVLLMSHMASPERLARECRRMVEGGAHAVGLFDSAGHYLPQDVSERIAAIRSEVDVPILFHAHNNLGMAVANAVAAAAAGATILDACARGFGAGAGNAQLEVLVPVLERLGYHLGIDLYALLDAAELAERDLIGGNLPRIDQLSIVSGLAGVFSGFKARVAAIAAERGVDARDIFFELGRRQVIAGQEDVIYDVADALLNGKMRRDADE